MGAGSEACGPGAPRGPAGSPPSLPFLWGAHLSPNRRGQGGGDWRELGGAPSLRTPSRATCTPFHPRPRPRGNPPLLSSPGAPRFASPRT